MMSTQNVLFASEARSLKSYHRSVNRSNETRKTENRKSAGRFLSKKSPFPWTSEFYFHCFCFLIRAIGPVSFRVLRRLLLLVIEVLRNGEDIFPFQTSDYYSLSE